MADLPVAKFHGVGVKTAEKLEALGITEGRDIQNSSPQFLAEKLGVFGWELYLKANGIHRSPVKPNRIRKSVGKEKLMESCYIWKQISKLKSVNYRKSGHGFTK